MGRRTTSILDAADRVTGIVNARGNLTAYAYDATGRRTSVTDPLSHTLTTYFDAAGNPTGTLDANGNPSTSHYDALNRKIRETDPLGKSATFSYNAVGLMTGSIDRLGRVRAFEFDALNRQTTQIWYTSGTPAATLAYSYDPAGNQVTASNTAGTYTMSYDALNRVTVATDVWGSVLTFSYDAVGNRTKVQDSKGGVETSTYDAGNRLTQRQQGSSGVTPLAHGLRVLSHAPGRGHHPLQQPGRHRHRGAVELHLRCGRMPPLSCYGRLFCIAK